MPDTRRRDTNPIKITGSETKGDLKVRYYDSGIVGMGTLRTKRCRTLEQAETFAAELVRTNALYVGMNGVAPRMDLTVYEVAELFIEDMATTWKPPMMKARRTSLNSHILPYVADVPCTDLELIHWVAIVDGVRKRGLSQSTHDNTIQSLRDFIAWATPRYMPKTAWGTELERKDFARRSRKRCAPPKRKSGKIGVGDVPTRDDITEFADALQEVWDRGRVFVWVLAVTGMRINECLALRAEDVDLGAMSVAIERSCSMHAPWPATTLPKGEKTRVCHPWHVGREYLEAAVDGADESGWLFPPDIEPHRHHGRQYWSNKIRERIKDVRDDIGWAERGWVNHTTRHFHASVSMAPREVGGFNLDASTVAENLGHTSTKLVFDTYSHTTGVAAVMEALTQEW